MFRNQKQRNLYVDAVRGFGVLLVLIHHAPIPSMILRAAILAFHMPLFFMITGLYISTPHTWNELKTKFIVDVKKIGIPYVFFEMLYFLLGFVDNIKLGGAVSIWEIITVSKGRLWFLPCLLWAKLYFYIISMIRDNVKISKNKQRAVNYMDIGAFAFFVLISWLQNSLDGSRWPFTVAHAFMATAFIILGRMLRQYLVEERTHGSKAIVVTVVSLLVCAVASAINGYIFNSGWLMYINEYGNYFFGIVGAIAGSVASFSFISYVYDMSESNSLFCTVAKKGLRLLIFLGTNSVLFFVTNEQIMGGIKVLLGAIGMEYGWFAFITTVIGCIVIVWPLSLLFNRFLPFAVGKNRVHLRK